MCFPPLVVVVGGFQTRDVGRFAPGFAPAGPVSPLPPVRARPLLADAAVTAQRPVSRKQRLAAKAAGTAEVVRLLRPRDGTVQLRDGQAKSVALTFEFGGFIFSCCDHVQDFFLYIGFTLFTFEKFLKKISEFLLSRN